MPGDNQRAHLAQQADKIAYRTKVKSAVTVYGQPESAQSRFRESPLQFSGKNLLEKKKLSRIPLALQRNPAW